METLLRSSALGCAHTALGGARSSLHPALLSHPWGTVVTFSACVTTADRLVVLILALKPPAGDQTMVVCTDPVNNLSVPQSPSMLELSQYLLQMVSGRINVLTYRKCLAAPDIANSRNVKN